jgi:hypothetical protein
MILWEEKKKEESCKNENNVEERDVEKIRKRRKALRKLIRRRWTIRIR